MMRATWYVKTRKLYESATVCSISRILTMADLIFAIVAPITHESNDDDFFLLSEQSKLLKRVFHCIAVKLSLCS
jgi:hypothetical protein